MSPSEPRRRATWAWGLRLVGVVAAGPAGAGCGGAAPESVAPVATAPAAPLPEEQRFSPAEAEIQGIAFGPEAVGMVAMPEVTGRGRPTLEQQRRRVARGRAHAHDAHILASLLWHEAARLAPSDPIQAGRLRDEARTALRGVAADAGGKRDALTLHMLASADMSLGDDGAAAAALEELATRFPAYEGNPALRVHLAHLYLRRRRVADASALTAEWKPDQSSDLRAYILAWVAFAAGDVERARQAIATAAATWKDAASRPAVERDLVLILARTKADVALAGRLIAAAAGGDPQRRYTWMFKLSEAYKFAGDYEAAARALDLLIEQGGAAIPPDDLVGFRYRQADYAFRRNRPTEAAERAIEAEKQLAACAAKCPESTAQAVIERILKLAQFSHTVYTKSQDGSHYDAAVALYRHYLALPARPDRSAAESYLRSLQETRASAEPGAGKHDQEVLVNLVLARRETLAACYEAALVTQPVLDGALRLTIEIEASGAVVGATSEPAAGAEGMAQVAGCAIAEARKWTFPSRAVPGTTALAMPLRFRLQQSHADGGTQDAG